jgi:hypothetical protein
MPQFAISSLMVPMAGMLPTTISPPDHRDWYIRELKPLVTSENDNKNMVQEFVNGTYQHVEKGMNKNYMHQVLVLWQLNEPPTNPDSPSDKSKVI